MSAPQRFSIVVVGDGAVGKSAMTLRFLRDQFHDEYDPTIEDSYCKHIEVDGQKYTLDITDTAGQEEYRGHWNDMFLRSGDGFICVFSITSMSSFQELVGFRTQIWRAKEDEYVPIVIAGNKFDLQDERQVDTAAAQQFAQLSNAFFIETSAKTGFNINEMMNELVRQIVRNKQRQQETSVGKEGMSSMQTINHGGSGGYEPNQTPMAKARVSGHSVEMVPPSSQMGYQYNVDRMPISLESTGSLTPSSTSTPPSRDAQLDATVQHSGTSTPLPTPPSLLLHAASGDSSALPAGRVTVSDHKTLKEQQRAEQHGAAVVQDHLDPSLSTIEGSGDSGETDVSSADNGAETTLRPRVHLPASPASRTSPLPPVSTATSLSTTTTDITTTPVLAKGTQMETNDNPDQTSSSAPTLRPRTRSTSASALSFQQLPGQKQPVHASIKEDIRHQEFKQRASSPSLSEIDSRDESYPSDLSAPFPSRNTRSTSRSRSMCPKDKNNTERHIGVLDVDDNENSGGVGWDGTTGGCGVKGATSTCVEEDGLHPLQERGDKGGTTLHCPGFPVEVCSVQNSIASPPRNLLIDQNDARHFRSTHSSPSPSTSCSISSSPCSSLSSSLSLSLTFASPVDLDSISDYFSLASSSTALAHETDPNHKSEPGQAQMGSGMDSCGKEYNPASETAPPLALSSEHAPTIRRSKRRRARFDVSDDKDSMDEHLSPTQEFIDTHDHGRSPNDKESVLMETDVNDSGLYHHEHQSRKRTATSMTRDIINTDFWGRETRSSTSTPTPAAEVANEGMRTRFRGTRRPPIGQQKASHPHPGHTSSQPLPPLKSETSPSPPLSSSVTVLANTSSSTALSSSTASSTLPFTPSARALSLASIDMTWNNPTQKPPFSYASLIARAILESSELRLTLGDIYGWITSRYPWYKHSPPTWQNSIRHNLSLNKAFRKLERATGEPGKGCFWSLEMAGDNTQTKDVSSTSHVGRRRISKSDTRSMVQSSSQPEMETLGAQQEDSDADERDNCKDSLGQHSVLSPAASDEAEYEKSYPRRSGRARKPPKPKDLDDFILVSSTSALSLHRPNSSPAPAISGALSTPPCSPGGPSEKNKSALGRVPSCDSVRRGGSNGVATTDAGEAGGDSDLIVTSRRVRRPPPKLSEFVSSEDFKASVVGGPRTGRRGERTTPNHSSSRISLSPAPTTPSTVSAAAQEGSSSFVSTNSSHSSSDAKETKKERRPKIEIVIPRSLRACRPSPMSTATEMLATSSLGTPKQARSTSFLPTSEPSGIKTSPPTTDEASGVPLSTPVASAPVFPRRPCPPSVSLSALSLKKRPSLDQTLYGGMCHDAKKSRRLSMQERRRSSMATGYNDGDAHADTCDEAARKRRRERKEEHQRLLQRIRREALKYEEDDWSGSDFEFLREEEEKYLRRICVGTRRGARPQQYRWRNDDVTDDDEDDNDVAEWELDPSEGGVGGDRQKRHYAGENEAQNRAKALLLDPSVIAYGFDSGDQDYILDYHQSPLFNSVSWPEFSDVKAGMGVSAGASNSTDVPSATNTGGHAASMESGPSAIPGSCTALADSLSMIQSPLSPPASLPLLPDVEATLEPLPLVPLSQPLSLSSKEGQVE
ncbi:Ras GTPase [Actinomortierella wolfii]|nr:Ras GTPase [Actinomortierella wolfii]